MSEMYVEYINSMAKNSFEYYHATMYEEVLHWNAEAAEFLARQEQKWGKCFVASRAMYVIAIETAQGLGEHLDGADIPEKKDKPYLYLALREIHGRSCQIYLEILHLMQLGFADGAYARWRSMYELSVVATFICDNGESTAKAFYDAAKTNDRYDWAKVAPCFKNKTSKRLSFDDIRRQCDFTDEWKEQWILANQVTHASPQGTFGRMGNMETLNIIPVGHSDYGITTPAEHSAISLAQISAIFFLLFSSYGEGLVAVDVLTRWIDLVRDYYFETHDEIFRDD